MASGKLNLEIGKKVSELESIMKEFNSKEILYKLIFRGKGLEFDSYRRYSPGDDASLIDWKASIRGNDLYVKKYIEERDLNILFIIDVSSSMVSGSTDKLKCEYAAELSAALSHLMISFNDKVGFVFYSDSIKKRVVETESGENRFNFFVSELENSSNYGGSSNLKIVLDDLLESLDNSINVVILISDFLNLKPDVEKSLRLFSGRFETLALVIQDPIDRILPNVKGEIILEDIETHQQILVDSNIAKKQYEKNALEKENSLKKIFNDSLIDFKILSTDNPFSSEIAAFLEERTKDKNKNFH